MWLAPERMDRADRAPAPRSPGPAAAACAAWKAWPTRSASRRTSTADPQFTAADDHRRDGRDAARPAPEPADPCRARRRLLAPARAAWSRCARMSAGTTRWTSWPARWRAQDVSAADGVLLLSSRISVELVQKAAMIGAPVRGRRVGADRAGVAHGRGRRHHPDRHRPRRRVRGLHPSRSALPRRNGAACRLTNSPTWPTRSASSLPIRSTTRRWRRSPTTCVKFWDPRMRARHPGASATR